MVVFGVIWVEALIFPNMGAGIQAPIGSISGTSNELTLEELTHSLSQNPIHHVHFEELYVSHFLTNPIKKIGSLQYVPPSRFEKHIVTPTEEFYVIDGDTVQYKNSHQGIDQTFSLQEVPALQVLITGLQAIFSGDLKTLRRYYKTELRGTHQQWALAMFPLHEEIRESVQVIRFRGGTNQIQEIEIHESNGDHSTLFLKK